jgi:hypothetical protein
MSSGQSAWQQQRHTCPSTKHTAGPQREWWCECGLNRVMNVSIGTTCGRLFRGMRCADSYAQLHLMHQQGASASASIAGGKGTGGIIARLGREHMCAELRGCADRGYVAQGAGGVCEEDATSTASHRIQGNNNVQRLRTRSQTRAAMQ